MRPNRSPAARAAASASARLVTSSLTTSRSSDIPTALATASVSRPVATTAWPAARTALAKSTPMPRPAPVMNQIFLLLMTSPFLLSETLNAVRDLRSFVPLVRELCHRQGEWLHVSGDSQWSCVHGFKADITNQTRRDVFRVLVVPAVHKARPAASPSLCVEYVEQHLTRDTAECG